MVQRIGTCLRGGFGGENKSSLGTAVRGDEDIHQPPSSMVQGMWKDKSHHLRGLQGKQ